MKNKLSVNILVDIAILIAMMCVSYSGLALQVRRTTLSWLALGYHRHFWRDIHIYASVVLLILLAIHIILHWSMVNAFFKKRIPNKPLRIVFYVLLLVMFLITVLPALYLI